MLGMFMNCSHAAEDNNMRDQQLVTETKSAERLAFEHYLRTGQRLSPQAWRQEVEHKFNPYHDSRNGSFTFAPGGPRSLRHVIISDRRGLHRARQHDSGSMAAADARATSAPTRPDQTVSTSEAVQIRTIDPSYRLDSLGFPTTLEGQTNLIRQLRLDRAVAFYRVKGETRPLQVETLRMMQERADSAYTEGRVLFDAGRLQPRLSREEAIGNYVDRAVRRELRDLYNVRGIDYSKGQQIRVIGREYDTFGSDPTYRIPDARIGNIAFDVTISRKTLATPQVRGYFNSDFKPDAVLIVRPTQLGPNSTYAISRPSK
jgi:hypothetical protein